MARIGVILVGRNMVEYVDSCLAPWVARRKALSPGDLLICAVSVPFEGFPLDPEDGTVAALKARREAGDIDRCIIADTPMRETEARSAALRWLVHQREVDLLWQVDLDEQYTEEDITRALAFVESNMLIDWFRLSLRNYVFDHYTYLTEPFTPPRIHRVRAGGYRAHGFYDDNAVTYGGTITRDLIPDTRFASMTIPKEQVWVKHLTWLSNERSRAKIRYQEARWPSSSFRWDDTKGLRFNEAHYAALGQPLPEIEHEDGWYRTPAGCASRFSTRPSPLSVFPGVQRPFSAK